MAHPGSVAWVPPDMPDSTPRGSFTVTAWANLSSAGLGTGAQTAYVLAKNGDFQNS